MNRARTTPATFLLGHSAYTGANRPARHSTYTSALHDLMGRGVPMVKAHTALKAALAGSHACALAGFNSCEVIAKLHGPAPHSTPATRYIREAAQRCRDGGISVDIDSPFGFVSIEVPGTDGCFMQDHEAEEFIEQVRALCKRYPSLDEDTAALSLAESYAEALQ